jgi:hypothetical protein
MKPAQLKRLARLAPPKPPPYVVVRSPHAKLCMLMTALEHGATMHDSPLPAFAKAMGLDETALLRVALQDPVEFTKRYLPLASSVTTPADAMDVAAEVVERFLIEAVVHGWADIGEAEGLIEPGPRPGLSTERPCWPPA